MARREWCAVLFGSRGHPSTYANANQYADSNGNANKYGNTYKYTSAYKHFDATADHNTIERANSGFCDE